jgi:hypothetical protein
VLRWHLAEEIHARATMTPAAGPGLIVGGVRLSAGPLSRYVSGLAWAVGSALGTISHRAVPCRWRPDASRAQPRRVRSSSIDVCPVQARRDVVDHAHPFVGEDLSGGGGASGDLVEQSSRRAAVGALVAVSWREIGADERLESRQIRGLRVKVSTRCPAPGTSASVPVPKRVALADTFRRARRERRESRKTR